MQNSMVVLIVTQLDQKYHFSANLFEKVKIVSVSWNLVPKE